MRFSFFYRVAAVLVAVAVTACISSAARICDGQEADLAASIRAHLAAGEFHLAQQLADAADSPQQRDALTQPIITAQAASGMFRASLASAASLYDDDTRARAFGELAQTPAGGSVARGGAALADFDTLIELIESTISPDSWDTVGGPGAVEPFPTGVLVDAEGLMKRVAIGDASSTVLAAARERARAMKGNDDIRRASALRKVSLTRLERELQARWAAGRGPDEAMANLAGLRRVQYLFVFPATRDIVLAGPAGDWATDAESRSVSKDDGAPILQLDDLVVALRNVYQREGRFGCAITPTKDNLASVQSYLSESATRSLKPHERDAWLDGLRARLGRQEISVFGIDPRTRTAQVLVEADYRMKLVGMGLEPGTRGVTSYLDSIEIPPGGSPPATTVLRWWFTLNYDAVRSTKAADAFSLHGPGVKVLSENELLTERGERIHTGESDALNRQFAQSFTTHFEELAAKYPVYAELRNVFDLALVAAILHSQALPGKVAWELSHWLDESRCELEFGPAPRSVETVMNHRLIDRKHIVVGVSGGVSVDARSLLQAQPIERDTYGQLEGDRANSAPPGDARWWWD